MGKKVLTYFMDDPRVLYDSIDVDHMTMGCEDLQCK